MPSKSPDAKRLKKTKGDTVHALVKAVVSTVPVAGGPLVEVFAYLVDEPVSKRRDAWIEQIAGSVRALEERLAKPLVEELKNDESFTTVLLSATHIAMRNHEKEKLDALANAVLNTGLGLAPDETERAIMLSLIDRMTPLHVGVLRIYLDRRNSAVVPFLENVYRFFPILRDREELARRIWKDLVDEELMRDGHFVLTGFGHRFLSFIGGPRI
jgi:hypothetical protein